MRPALSRSWIALMLALTALTGCSLRLNEPEPEPRSFPVEAKKQGCLHEAPAILERFFAGTASEPEIQSFWDCASSSIELFLAHTGGKHKDSYTPEELSSFLVKYFLDGKTPPPSLVDQAMRLKKGLIGGRADRITRGEFQRTLGLLKLFREQSLAIRTILPLDIDSILTRAKSEPEFERTLRTFERSMFEIGRGLEGTLGVYSLGDMNSLLAELDSYFGAGQFGWLKASRKLAELVGPAKAIFIAPPATELVRRDWPRFFYLVPRYYGLFLRAKFYFQTPKDYQQGTGLVQITRLVNDALSLLGKSLGNRPTGRIEQAELDGFLKSLEIVGLLPIERLRAEKILALVTEKFFPDPEAKSGVSIANLASLRETYDYLAEGLRALEGLYRTALGDGFLTRSLTEKEALRHSEEDLLAFTARKDLLARRAVRDLRKNVAEVHTVFPGAESIVRVSKAAAQPHSYQHLRRVHYLRAANHVLLRAYSNGKRTMNAAEVAELLRDLDPLLAFFNASGEVLAQSAPARLFEASMFLPNSDGDEELTIPEALEFETLLLSTWDMEPKVHGETAAKCSARPGSDGFVGIEAGCYRVEFAAHIGSHWSHAPELATAVEQLGIVERVRLLEDMDAFVRKGREREPYSTLDTKAMLLVAYYIEYLYARFDLNRDDVLDEIEARDAYPVFQPFLSRKARKLGFQKPDEHYKIFTFILSHRKIPRAITEKLEFLMWDKDGEFQVRRLEIAAIFSALLGL